MRNALPITLFAFAMIHSNISSATEASCKEFADVTKTFHEARDIEFSARHRPSSTLDLCPQWKIMITMVRKQIQLLTVDLCGRPQSLIAMQQGYLGTLEGRAQGCGL